MKEQEPAAPERINHINISMPTGLSINLSSNELTFSELAQSFFDLKYYLENPEEKSSTKKNGAMIG